MKSFRMTRNEFKKLLEIFENHNPDYVDLTFDNSNGIGSVVTAEFETRSKIKIDITDIESW
jgi:hypothetical protein